MKKNALDFWVGLFVVLGFVSLLFLALKAGNMSSLSFQSTYPVKLAFDNVGGLKPRAAVKSAGVTVGRVGAIRFDPANNYTAQVTINLDRQYPFPKDTSAAIMTSGLLGEQYIGLTPGDDDQMLKAGDTINRTQSAIVLEDIIGKLMYSKMAEAGGSGPAAGTTAGASSGQATAQPVEQPAGQLGGQPAGQSVGQPAGQPASHATGQPASQSAGQAATQPASPAAGR